MFCVACMRIANDSAVQMAIALLFMSRNETMQNKHNSICVLTRFDVSNMDCFACIACMIFADDGVVTFVIAPLVKTNTQNNVLRVNMCNHL